MKKTIVVLGDSLALHRPNCNISNSDTYSFLLNEILGDFYVINKSKRANHIINQTSNLSDDIFPESEYYIIHIGIVDCYPRVFSRQEHEFVNKLKPFFLKKFIIDFASKNRYFLTKLFQKVFVSKKEFENKFTYLIRKILIETGVKKIYLLNIAKTPEHISYRTFNVNKNTVEYNEILSKIQKRYDRRVELIDFYSLTEKTPDLLLEDGQHIKKETHKFLAQMISEKILIEESLCQKQQF